MYEIICSYCKNKFLLIAVKNKKVIVHKKEMELEYFVCPHCNVVHKIVLKDQGYNVLLKEVIRANKKFQEETQKSNGMHEESKKKYEFLERKKKHLAKHVDVTNKLYPGSFTLLPATLNNEEKIIYHE